MLVFAFCLSGCSPQVDEESDAGRVQETSQPPSPPKRSFVVLNDLTVSEDILFREVLSERLGAAADWELRWERVADHPSSPDWDVALLRAWSLGAVGDESADLQDMLEDVYPLHRADFVVSASEMLRDGSLTSLPILLLPDFLYIKTSVPWATSPDAEVFRKHVEGGGKVGLREGEAGEWYRGRLGIPPEQAVDLDETAENPYLAGEIEIAIYDRSWLVELNVPGNEIHSLAEIGLDSQIPDWGYRFAVSKNCPNLALAGNLLRLLLVEGHDSILGINGAVFPMRRSVLNSPRMQGMTMNAPKAVFERTLGSLDLFPF